MSSTDAPVLDDARANHTRLLRGVAAGFFATFVALFSHIAGGGQSPTPLGVGVPLLFAVFVCVVLGGRKASLVRLSASVGISQTVFHWIFEAASRAPSGAVGTTAADAAGASAAQLALHANHVGGVPSGFASAVTGAGASHHAAHGDGAMTAAHIVAAAVTIAVLYRSEVVLRALAGLLRMVGSTFAPLRRLLTDTAMITSPRLHLGTGCEVDTPASLGVIRSTRLDRGPPAGVLAHA
ncbi:hypothetical protein [Brevibacterium jeotgali]|nr:hypothetical protein [Brevibacterium jeotgali]